MTRRPLERLEPGLPAGWYHDPAHYQRELEAVWYRRWVAVAREEEVPAIGDWRLVCIGTQKIVVLRDEDGQLRAFHNTCRHRGSVLCTEESGRFARSRIVCPYHSWTYDLSGRLVATPRRMETPDFRMEDFPLYRVATAAWGGFVFVNLSGKSPLDVGGIGRRLKPAALQNPGIGNGVVPDVQANRNSVPGSFSECSRCPPVHPELCRVVSAYRDAGAWGLRG